MATNIFTSKANGLCFHFHCTFHNFAATWQVVGESLQTSRFLRCKQQVTMAIARFFNGPPPLQLIILSNCSNYLPMGQEIDIFLYCLPEGPKLVSRPIWLRFNDWQCKFSIWSDARSYVTSQLKRVWQIRERKKEILSKPVLTNSFSHINKVILIMISVFLSMYWTSLIFPFLQSLCRIFDDSGLNLLELFLKLCPMQTWITFSQCDQFSQSAYSSPQSPH